MQYLHFGLLDRLPYYVTSNMENCLAPAFACPTITNKMLFQQDEMTSLIARPCPRY